jgi:ERCC4-type nuclease
MAPEAKGHAVGQPINIVRQEETLALHVAAKGCAITREPQEGDASFWGYLDGEPAHIGVERKHADDLIKSYKSGHLADQLRRMLDTYSLVILLVEGSLWPIGADRHAHSITTMSAGQSCSFDALMNDLQTWQDVGVRMQWTEHNDAGRRLWSLYHYYQKKEHFATVQPRLKKSKDTLLLSTPGLGPKRVERLLRLLIDEESDSEELSESVKAVQSVLGKGKLYKAFIRKLKKE